MNDLAMEKLLARSMEPEELEKSITYVSNQLKTFLFPKEKVLICFHYHKYGNISYVMEQAVRRTGAIPVLWEHDFRWINLLRLAFSKHVGCVIGPPLILLGLAKVAKFMQTPLFIRDVVMAGYPSLDWMTEGIQRNLDCKTWGFFNMGLEGVVCGCSCQCSPGVHLWEEEYGLDILDDWGNTVSAGVMGRIKVYRKTEPEVSFILPDCGVLEHKPCMCGNTSSRLIHMMPQSDQDLFELGQTLQRWTSVLDCRLTKGPSGLEIELIYFQGERLPNLPHAAKLNMHPWNPETDEPFWYFPISKNPDVFPKND